MRGKCAALRLLGEGAGRAVCGAGTGADAAGTDGDDGVTGAGLAPRGGIGGRAAGGSEGRFSFGSGGRSPVNRRVAMRLPSIHLVKPSAPDMLL